MFFIFFLLNLFLLECVLHYVVEIHASIQMSANKSQMIVDHLWEKGCVHTLKKYVK